MISEGQIKALYNTTNKDMPFAEFRREMREIMDPVKISRDLKRIMANKQIINRVTGN